MSYHPAKSFELKCPPRSKHIFYIVLLILIGLSGWLKVAGCTPAIASDLRETRRILVLHSYHPGFTWTDNISTGINASMKGAGGKVELLFEFMDTRRVHSDDYFQKLEELYTIKYRDRAIDVIICADDHALNFITKISSDLFTKGACGFLQRQRISALDA